MSGGTQLDRAALEDHPLPPVEQGDKHSHGRMLVVAGSRSLPGAALLCATAAMRAGAGKLQIATVASVAPFVGIAMPESRTVGLQEGEDGGFAAAAVKPIAELACDADAVVAGPGMADGPVCEKLAATLLESERPLALDAGLLRALPAAADAAKRVKRVPILLPHSGELAALLGCDEAEVEADPIAAGRRCAERYQALTLVKGATSHIVHPDSCVWTYADGAAGLGVSGSGDVLAGIVGGLLARGAGPLTALLWAVWLHGEAGAVLSKTIGPVGFLAREIPGEIPALLR